MGMVYWGVPQRLGALTREMRRQRRILSRPEPIWPILPWWAAHHFNRVISIEADRELCDAAEEAIGVLRERQCCC